MMRILLTAMLSLTAACAARTPPPAVPPPASPADRAADRPADRPAEPGAPGTRCDANAAGGLIGRAADGAVREAQRLSGARVVRRYKTGDMLTMDFRPDRLNVETDAAGTIVKLGCG